MAKKTPLEKLPDAIEKIMQEYGQNTIAATQKAITEAAKQGAKQIKANSGIFKGTGKYKSGWTYKVEKTQTTAIGKIYNSNQPGLPHLLEHGHAKVVGGRRYPDPVKGRPHIKPVQDELNSLLPQQIAKMIGDEVWISNK